MVYGINIGNTNVSAAVSQSNRVAVIANAGGEHRSRSVVAKGQEAETAVGTAALNSRNTVLFNNIHSSFTTEGGKHVINKQVSIPILLFGKNSTSERWFDPKCARGLVVRRPCC